VEERRVERQRAGLIGFFREKRSASHKAQGETQKEKEKCEHCQSARVSECQRILKNEKFR
jgi:hypothetical protein